MLQLYQASQHIPPKQLLHGDTKGDKIVLTKTNSEYHPMLLDFGKSIMISEAPSKRMPDSS